MLLMRGSRVWLAIGKLSRREGASKNYEVLKIDEDGRVSADTRLECARRTAQVV